jgi:hypothetical protein
VIVGEIACGPSNAIKCVTQVPYSETVIVSADAEPAPAATATNAAIDVMTRRTFTAASFLRSSCGWTPVATKNHAGFYCAAENKSPFTNLPIQADTSVFQRRFAVAATVH